MITNIFTSLVKSCSSLFRPNEQMMESTVKDSVEEHPDEVVENAIDQLSEGKEFTVKFINMLMTEVQSLDEKVSKLKTAYNYRQKETKRSHEALQDNFVDSAYFESCTNRLEVANREITNSLMDAAESWSTIQTLCNQYQSSTEQVKPTVNSALDTIPNQYNKELGKRKMLFETLQDAQKKLKESIPIENTNETTEAYRIETDLKKNDDSGLDCTSGFKGRIFSTEYTPSKIIWSTYAEIPTASTQLGSKHSKTTITESISDESSQTHKIKSSTQGLNKSGNDKKNAVKRIKCKVPVVTENTNLSKDDQNESVDSKVSACDSDSSSGDSCCSHEVDDDDNDNCNNDSDNDSINYTEVEEKDASSLSKEESILRKNRSRLQNRSPQKPMKPISSIQFPSNSKVQDSDDSCSEDDLIHSTFKPFITSDKQDTPYAISQSNTNMTTAATTTTMMFHKDDDNEECCYK